MIALRRESAPPPPSDVSISNQAIAAGDHEIPVRIYRPGTRAPHPGIVYFHGGGWMFGSAEQSDSIAIRYCRAADAVVVSPDYRLSPEHPFPAGFEDCRNALMWTFRSSKLLGVDADRIAVAGESSGANLAAACAIDVRDSGAPPLALQVLVYPALGLDFDTTSYVENAAAPVLSRDEMTFFWEGLSGGRLGDSGSPRRAAGGSGSVRPGAGLDSERRVRSVTRRWCALRTAAHRSRGVGRLPQRGAAHSRLHARMVGER